ILVHNDQSHVRVPLLHNYSRPFYPPAPIPHILFSFNHTATTDLYTLSLHDALPIFLMNLLSNALKYSPAHSAVTMRARAASGKVDRKSTRLNSSHQIISYAVFCLKKKKKYLIIFG